MFTVRRPGSNITSNEEQRSLPKKFILTKLSVTLLAVNRHRLMPMVTKLVAYGLIKKKKKKQEVAGSCLACDIVTSYKMLMLCSHLAELHLLCLCLCVCACTSTHWDMLLH